MEYHLIPRHTFNRTYVSLRIGNRTFAVPESHRPFVNMDGYSLTGVYEITDNQMNQPIKILRQVDDNDTLITLLSQLRVSKKTA